MGKFYVQVPATEMFPEETLEFFDELWDIESYVEHLLTEIFPELNQMEIYTGLDMACVAIRGRDGIQYWHEDKYLFA